MLRNAIAYKNRHGIKATAAHIFVYTFQSRERKQCAKWKSHKHTQRENQKWKNRHSIQWTTLFFNLISLFFNSTNFHRVFLSSFWFICRVQNLKETIERLHGIPATKQVLMISGGEVLNPVSRVCSYPSGTDENPIYMFSILFDNSKLLPPWPSECRKYLFVNSNKYCCCYFLSLPYLVWFIYSI